MLCRVHPIFTCEAIYSTRVHRVIPVSLLLCRAVIKDKSVYGNIYRQFAEREDAHGQTFLSRNRIVTCAFRVRAFLRAGEIEFSTRDQVGSRVS